MCGEEVEFLNQNGAENCCLRSNWSNRCALTPNCMSDHFIVELLDNDFKNSIHSWEVTPGIVCQLGRSPESDIVVQNPFVSRTHAYLVFENEQWLLNSVSQHGIAHNGKIEKTVVLTDGDEFRLSRKGPLLRFRVNPGVQDAQVDTTKTFSEEGLNFLFLPLDEEERDREVAEIEKQDYFSDLKSIASKLKNQREPGS